VHCRGGVRLNGLKQGGGIGDQRWRTSQRFKKGHTTALSEALNQASCLRKTGASGFIVASPEIHSIVLFVANLPLLAASDASVT